MDERLYKMMMRYHPDGLCERFYEQYLFEYGGKKISEIVNETKKSQKVADYVSGLLINNHKPSAKGLVSLMNTIQYFMFSKEETLCFGALGVFTLWKSEYMYALNINDIIIQEEIEMTFTSICAELIWNCSINKYNQFDNFFIRFFNKLSRLN